LRGQREYSYSDAMLKYVGVSVKDILGGGGGGGGSKQLLETLLCEKKRIELLSHRAYCPGSLGERKKRFSQRTRGKSGAIGRKVKQVALKVSAETEHEIIPEFALPGERGRFGKRADNR